MAACGECTVSYVDLVVRPSVMVARTIVSILPYYTGCMTNSAIGDINWLEDTILSLDGSHL